MSGFVWSASVYQKSNTTAFKKPHFIHEACITTTGLTVDELLKMENFLFQISTNKEHTKIQTALKKLCLNGYTTCRHSIIHHQTQEVIHVESRMAASYDNHKRIDRIDGFTLDISEVVQLEEQIKMLQLNLIQLTSLRPTPKADAHHIQPKSTAMCKINLPIIIEDCLRKLRPFFESKNIKISADTHTPNLYVKGHPNQLESVFMCVLMNAIDAIDNCTHSQIDIQITQQNDSALLSIKDSGLGISEENQNKIFTPFFTTKPAISSGGIGLSISQKIIQNYGGDINFETHPKFGTTFYIRIPHCNSETTDSINTYTECIDSTSKLSKHSESQTLHCDASGQTET
jgi:signal transduction histidine kinase